MNQFEKNFYKMYGCSSEEEFNTKMNERHKDCLPVSHFHPMEQAICDVVRGVVKEKK